MRKIILLALIATAISGCKKTPDQVAQKKQVKQIEQTQKFDYPGEKIFPNELESSCIPTKMYIGCGTVNTANEYEYNVLLPSKDNSNKDLYYKFYKHYAISEKVLLIYTTAFRVADNIQATGCYNDKPLKKYTHSFRDTNLDFGTLSHSADPIKVIIKNDDEPNLQEIEWHLKNTGAACTDCLHNCPPHKGNPKKYATGVITRVP